MKVILDEGVPEALADRLAGHQVSTVRREGWGGIENGKLLDLIERAGFQAFITNDKRIERERDLGRRPFATLILSVANWKIIRERVQDILNALVVAEPSKVAKVDCGQFVPRRFR